eukprot:COSAG01_NODE_492_length_16335_cov_63.722284_3_plen_86_part_00
MQLRDHIVDLLGHLPSRSATQISSFLPPSRGQIPDSLRRFVRPEESVQAALQNLDDREQYIKDALAASQDLRTQQVLLKKLYEES